MKDVLIFNDIVKDEVIQDITRHILSMPYWRVAWEGKPGENRKYRFDEPDMGFSMQTFCRNIDNDNPTSGTVSEFERLNHLANMVAQNVTKRISKAMYFTLWRIMWNYYSPTSKGDWHNDMDTDNYVSIVFNLHTNDGSTEFKDRGIVPSVRNQAIFFPSNILHKGNPPVNDTKRLNLNLVLKKESRND